METGRQRTRRIFCAIVAAFVAQSALAQQQTPAPTPAPSRTPTIVTLPGVVPERYSLPGATPVPIPVPAPIATPTAAPSASPVARTESSDAVRRSVRLPERKIEVASPRPVPSAAPSPIPAPLATGLPNPPSVIPVAVPAAAAPAAAIPGWLWMIIGAAGTAAVAGAAWLVLRRRPGPAEPEPGMEEQAPVPTALPQPIGPAPASPSRPAPLSVVPSSQPEPFEVTVQPLQIALGEREVVLEFELLVGNLQPAAAEGIRASLAMISASPDQDRILQSFHRGPPGEVAGDPFDLAPGRGVRMPVRLSLPREQVYVVEFGGRPMFVAMVLVDLRWRSGLSIRRFGADFMVGAAGQGERIGPIWLDRGAPTGPLGVTRYIPRERAAA